MRCIMDVFYLFAILSIVNLSWAGKRKAQGKVKYQMNWLGGFQGCSGFDNKVIDAVNLKLKKDSPTSTSLGGDFTFIEPIIDNTAILMIVTKDTPQGEVLAYTIEIPNLCDHVKEEGMPYSVFFDSMNLDPRACPLPQKTFPVDGIKLSMSAINDQLNHEMVGEYSSRIEFRHRGEGLDVTDHILSCYTIGFTIDEVREEAE